MDGLDNRRIPLSIINENVKDSVLLTGAQRVPIKEKSTTPLGYGKSPIKSTPQSSHKGNFMKPTEAFK